MRDAFTTYERREGIKLFLIKQRTATTLQLAFMFGVSKRTILNDIIFLSSRLPITTKAGNGGGIFLDMEFESPKMYLTAEEENLLIRLSETVSKKDRLIVRNIIYKFSLPPGK